MKVKVKSNLEDIFKARGLKLKWVAEEIGATPSQLTNWCKNEDGCAKSTPNVVYILRLEKLLNVGVKDMFEEV